MTANTHRESGRALGEARKLSALTLLADYRDVVIRRAQRQLLTALLATGSATIDDVRELVELPPGIDPTCYGAVPLGLARARIIRRAGYTPTCRPVAHARPVSVWTLVDHDRALRWLDTHPDQSGPGDDHQGADHQRYLLDL